MRYGLNPIVVVLNNGGYGTERGMQDGTYNDILNWNYHRLPEIFGAGRGFRVETEGELEEALVFAAGHKESFCLLDVQLDPADHSPALDRLTERLGQRL